MAHHGHPSELQLEKIVCLQIPDKCQPVNDLLHSVFMAELHTHMLVLLLLQFPFCVSVPACMVKQKQSNTYLRS